MKIIKNKLDLNKAIKDFNNFGFVPTMGGIHDGHISLIKNSQRKCKKTIVSIFINPAQFNDKKDFKKYPRNLNKDIKILKKYKVDYLFIPSIDEIYKNKTTNFKIHKKDLILCAKHRIGHFEGVLKVMNILLKIIRTKNVFMGEKDFQQIFLIRKYLTKKHRIKIINCRTIRDKNMIALSTRNKLLSKKNYLKASQIATYLHNLKNEIINKKKKIKISFKQIIHKLENLYKIKVEYLELRNEKNLNLSNSNQKCKLLIAYYINNVRLIDNF